MLSGVCPIWRCRLAHNIREANSLANVGSCAVDMEDWRAAHDYFVQSRDLFAALGHEQYVAYVDNELQTVKGKLEGG